MDYVWYKSLNNSSSLEQGDLIKDCPIVIPPAKLIKDDVPEVEVKLINSIVLSQSCDLVNDKIQIVLVCPYYTLKYFIDNLPENQKTTKAVKKHIDNLRKGNLPSYHLLNKFEELEINDYLVVDFRNVYGIQIDNIKEIAANLNARIRLLPPYREHLSQAFARYFMRVGLPQDIVVEGYK
jgi:hypothetical protein